MYTHRCAQVYTHLCYTETLSDKPYSVCLSGERSTMGGTCNAARCMPVPTAAAAFAGAVPAL
jgi:hypothetical protein